MELEIIGCPECQATAEVESWPGATRGKFAEHVRIRCVRKHWFLLPRGLLEAMQARQGAALSEG